MPIQVNNFVDQDTGVTVAASYWKIRVVTLNTDTNVAEINLYGYNNLAAAQAGKKQAKTAFYTATFAQLGITGSTTIAQLQTAIYNYCLTAVDSLSGTVLLAGGTIV